MKIISVVGARPNFMKIAPFIRAIEAYNAANPTPGIQHILVHTGQHYDNRMSKNFFDELNIPNADINLGIGSGTHAQQVGNTMIAFEKVIKEHKPDWVVVVGDVNATLACSVTAKKELVKVCHIEAGLRSGDIAMPEEINRLVTDRLSDLLLCPDHLSQKNLRVEGVPENKIKFVGNIMIDTLDNNFAKAQQLNFQEILNKNQIDGNRFSGIQPTGPFGILTMHRPSNVDDPEILTQIIDFITRDVVQNIPLLFTVHPRTRKNLESAGLWKKIVQHKSIMALHPLSYHEMLHLNHKAQVMLTDSGGLQEECTVLGTPCLTLRFNTERPITLKEHGGASVLVGNNVEKLREEFHVTLSEMRKPVRPEKWDGQTAKRCVREILNFKN